MLIVEVFVFNINLTFLYKISPKDEVKYETKFILWIFYSKRLLTLMASVASSILTEGNFIFVEKF